ncbi:hypothetical protein H257_16631 [Aphanomyces astaci]|uniref:PWI domain-containing protein n=1 Tax=Aphanomyces astaci TaxID=112090 RepID=W4FHW3_APHAT|nr:hypothetical protein H257_16631 [Aphanomyces astaci]ETV67077.1 hypothetical protein H257_16631 [Aphanomyces astaci]|eukprot:XP_009843446.1 hypothetical protein H257_16631 [Aphanomyces astaci]
MAPAYDPAFVGHVEAEDKAAFQNRLVEKLSEVLEQEVEGVMAEYIVVMVGNQKTMKEIHDEMVDFMGAESAESAVACIYNLLRGPPATAIDASPSPPPPSASPSPEPSSDSPTTTTAPPSTKIINLSGIKASSTVDLSGKSSSTIRVIGSSATSKDLKHALKSRSERFGIPEKKIVDDKPSSSSSSSRPTKLSITERLGGRDTKKDAPPSSSSSRTDRSRQDSQRPSRSEPRDSNKKRKGPNDPDDKASSSRDQDDQRASKRPARDGDRYPPGPRGPYPFPPMFQGYPPYHMPPPEFMYGYPPHHPHHPHPHMPGFGYPGMPRGPYPPPGAPRRFNNKWINPAAAAAAEGATDVAADKTDEPAGEPDAPKPQPVGFGYPPARPRFQNKTWVRPEPQDPPTPQADEALSASLPKTP